MLPRIVHATGRAHCASPRWSAGAQSRPSSASCWTPAASATVKQGAVRSPVSTRASRCCCARDQAPLPALATLTFLVSATTSDCSRTSASSFCPTTPPGTSWFARARVSSIATCACSCSVLYCAACRMLDSLWNDSPISPHCVCSRCISTSRRRDIASTAPKDWAMRVRILPSITASCGE
eukprot:4377897-Prymnesium_polylepis.2